VPHAHVDTPRELRAGLLVGAALTLLAGWLLAGSAGLLAHPLRRGLAVAFLLGAGLSAWPWGRRPAWSDLLLWLAGIAVSAVLVGSALPPVAVLGVVLFAMATAQLQGGPPRLALRLCGNAVFALAIFRLACNSIPWVWMVADRVAQALGSLGGLLTRQPLRAGASFVGLDLLVPMVYLALAVARCPGHQDGTRSAWLRRAVPALVAVLACQVAYLMLLTYAPAVLELPWMQVAKPERPIAGATPPPPGWIALLRLMIPWNLPALAALLQAFVAGAILRHVPPHSHTAARREAKRHVLVGRGTTAAAVLALAAVLPLTTHRFSEAPSLQGKKIVLFEKGFLNWLKPQHGQYGRLSIGMYGMMPIYLESLGARPLVSPDLSEKDLEGASAVVLLFPNEPWAPGQKERLWRFVEQGGSLLVMGEHTTWEKGADGKPINAAPGVEVNRFNEILAPTAMRVAFDSATFAVGGWLHSYEALTHPTTAAINDQSNEFGVVIGASVKAGWPARPLLLGRWGWADPGDTASPRAMMGNGTYDPGERLGDLVLAAEQPFGKGKIIAFGDTSGLTNGITVGCHPYTSRLYTYLAATGVAQPGWRLALGLLGWLALAALLAWRPQPWLVVATAGVLALSVSLCSAATAAAWNVLPDGYAAPDGKPRPVNRLAYIDASHYGSFSAESWRPEGLGALAMTLMRNDFLALSLDDFEPRRLEHARLLIVAAPSKPFRRDERKTVVDFIRKGGVLIATVGYDDRGASQELLQDLGFRIGQSATAEAAGRQPQALGHFKAPFFDGGSYLAYVRFHAAWPVLCGDPNRLVISRYPTGEELIVMRRLGQGLVVVIGDSFFATNKNLENEGGEPFEGLRENAVFWRWLLALLREGVGEGQSWPPPASECTPLAPPPQAQPATSPGAAAPPPAANPNPQQEAPP
jgi:hypothetical protein